MKNGCILKIDNYLTKLQKVAKTFIERYYFNI